MQIHVWKTTWNIWFWSVKIVLVKNRFRYRTVHQMKRKLTFHVLISLIIWIIHSRILPTLARSFLIPRRRRTQSMRRVRWKTSARCNEFIMFCWGKWFVSIGNARRSFRTHWSERVMSSVKSKSTRQLVFCISTFWFKGDGDNPAWWSMQNLGIKACWNLPDFQIKSSPECAFIAWGGPYRHRRAPKGLPHQWSRPVPGKVYDTAPTMYTGRCGW